MRIRLFVASVDAGSLFIVPVEDDGVSVLIEPLEPGDVVLGDVVLGEVVLGDVVLLSVEGLVVPIEPDELVEFGFAVLFELGSLVLGVVGVVVDESVDVPVLDEPVLGLVFVLESGVVAPGVLPTRASSLRLPGTCAPGPPGLAEPELPVPPAWA